MPPSRPLPAATPSTAEAESIPSSDDNIEKVVVTVTRNGDTLLVAEDYKVNR